MPAEPNSRSETPSAEPGDDVRPLRPDDAAACLALDQRCLGGLWSASQWDTELAAESRPGLGLWRGGALAAMACGWLIVDELHVTLVAVDPQQRRRGLGGRVLAALLQQAQADGARHATLEVASDNDAALALYGRLGFREAGVRRGYYRDGRDALIQWLRLPGSQQPAGER